MTLGLEGPSSGEGTEEWHTYPGQGLVLGRGRKEAGLHMGDLPVEDQGELQGPASPTWVTGIRSGLSTTFISFSVLLPPPTQETEKGCCLGLSELLPNLFFTTCAMDSHGLLLLLILT